MKITFESSFSVFVVSAFLAAAPAWAGTGLRVGDLVGMTCKPDKETSTSVFGIKSVMRVESVDEYMHHFAIQGFDPKRKTRAPLEIHFTTKDSKGKFAPAKTAEFLSAEGFLVDNNVGRKDFEDLIYFGNTGKTRTLSVRFDGGKSVFRTPGKVEYESVCRLYTPCDRIAAKLADADHLHSLLLQPADDLKVMLESLRAVGSDRSQPVEDRRAANSEAALIASVLKLQANAKSFDKKLKNLEDAIADLKASRDKRACPGNGGPTEPPATDDGGASQDPSTPPQFDSVDQWSDYLHRLTQ